MNDSMIQTIRDYFATQPVLKAWLFGSYARGEETPESDVDILVEFDHDNAIVGLLQYCRIMNELSDRIGKDVDLVENGTLLPFAEKTANQDKRLIYERKS
ncbi:MAG: nucleotidyltransferase domain-containing protein [Bacteroidales bacterium]|nr:nucleotidyltransferase domain-containing protein [Bacteroidales bacterium]